MLATIAPTPPLKKHRGRCRIAPTVTSRLKVRWELPDIIGGQDCTSLANLTIPGFGLVPPTQGPRRR